MRSLLRRVGFALLATLLLLAGVLLLRAWRMPSQQLSNRGMAKPRVVDALAAAKRLSQAVQLETVTADGVGVVRPEAFEALHALMRRSFPLTHEKLSVETVAELSLLYSWPGSEPKLPPVVLLAHQDVVPIADPDAWSAPPFKGRVDERFVWGRGTLDDKSSLFGILEAVEHLLAEGFAPERTVLLAFGHDEEILGAGAEALAALILRRHGEPQLVLDEGSGIVEGVVPAIDAPVALVGITEKGYATLEVTALAEGGHSSMPPKVTATGKLAEAVRALEKHPFPSSLEGPVGKQFDYLGPEMGFGLRLAMANRWLLGGVIEGAMSKTAAGRAQLRTSSAVTMLEASPKENVLASRATAVVNFRIRPGDTVAEVQRGVKNLVGEGFEVTVRPGAGDPPPVSRLDDEVFSNLQRTVADVFPEAVFAPSLVVATTDARRWAGRSDHVYRFLPVTLGPDDLSRFHGVDERLAIADYADAIRFYARLIERFASPHESER